MQTEYENQVFIDNDDLNENEIQSFASLHTETKNNDS